MKITCIERKYKVRGHGMSYNITAKREFDEELTDRLLHEDMELKTFLQYYEITGVQKDEDFSEDISGLSIETDSQHIQFSEIKQSEIQPEIQQPEIQQPEIQQPEIQQSGISEIQQSGISEIQQHVPQSDISEIQKPSPTKFMEPIRREWIVLHYMPEEFSLEDVAKICEDKIGHYDIKKLKERFSATLQKLKKEHKVEIINPEKNPRYRKYRLLVNENREFDKMMEDMKQDEKISVAT